VSKFYTRKLAMPEGWSHTNFYEVTADGGLNCLIHQVRPGGDYWSEESYFESFFIFDPKTDTEISAKQYVAAWTEYDDFHESMSHE
jgi:hypothetical protein